MPEGRDNLAVGVWIELPPAALLTGEGILHALARLLPALLRKGKSRVVIACAEWSVEGLRQMMREHDIPEEGVEFLTAGRRVPVIVQLHRRLSRKKTTKFPSLFWCLRSAVSWVWESSGLGRFLRWLIATDSWVVFVLTCVLLLPLLALLALPILLLDLLLGLRFPRSIIMRIRRFLAGRLSRSARVQQSAPKVRRALRESVMEREYKELASRASGRADVGVWFVPHPASSSAVLIESPLVVAIPDFVCGEFPSLFRGTEPVVRGDAVRKTVEKAAATISYSEAVREQHVIGYLGVNRSRTHVIAHAPTVISEPLDKRTTLFDGNRKQAALSIIHEHVRGGGACPIWSPYFPKDYLLDFPFDEVQYLFVSSQIRPHKNHLNLFRAFEVLLRRKHVDLKLFITGSLWEETYGLRDFLRARRLEYDVISVPRLPRDVHAAFCHLAALTIVPSLFEGGFPFQFTESLSVGTPVVMSSIPVTRETLPRELWPSTLFDPYDVNDMVATIAQAVACPEDLVKAQEPFYRELLGRTWDDVAAEYLAVFSQAQEGRAAVAAV